MKEIRQLHWMSYRETSKKGQFNFINLNSDGSDSKIPHRGLLVSYD